ncbi:MAG: four helix bundle protein [Akkermansiaceae bacterium]|nr:four helix bundle protein [Akkermansiaceae bacterium]
MLIMSIPQPSTKTPCSTSCTNNMNNKKGKLKNAAIKLAVQTINLYDEMHGKMFLKNQMAKSATSIGANIHEADYAESHDDFVHKLKIALKECHEFEFWMQIVSTSYPELSELASKLRREAGDIRYMLISSIKTLNASGNEK